ncbi:hypothetical protein [Lederbergia citrea]|uniref:Uncharacterized protein n=1 Tax=Lederbergia citrea TaxID=2833581 RepID=A0A942UM14_9BACI|nr:hypothetical protein [Lederbergia citrea]MBS4223840.1 hypothetical protein [Lederbergia citrea]
MSNESQSEYQYNIVLSILAEMVSSYITTEKEKDLSKIKKGDGKLAG